ncbi:MAG: FAD-dependent oxidoreductase [Elusimicrobiota bacterium]
MSEHFDVVIVGGGVTGAGVARDCAMRGLKTLLLERGAPGRATTESSTHLIHGGLRYLLYDRLTTHTTCWDSGHIVRIARPLLQRLPILWPVYRGQSHGLETVETLLEVYDGFQKMKGGRPHLRLTAGETLRLVPGLKADGLKGALAFDEWWVDPVGLVEKNLESARRFGAEVRSGTAVTGLLRSIGRIDGVSTDKGDIRAGVVINAAGPWVDKVAVMAGTRIPLRLQKGTHLIYKEKLVPVGLLLEAAGGGRYVFVVPSPQGTLVGPTDLAAPEDPDEVRSSPEELRYLLDSVKLYLPSFPQRYDATIVGARPILGQAGSEKLLSREFEVFDHGSRDGLEGFLTIGGGKMSDFRVMAESVTSLACRKLGVPNYCRTHLETLEGQPVGEIPSFPRPSKPLKNFLRRHPRLRELHALAYLGGALGRHLARKAAGGAPVTGAEALKAHFA